MNGIILDENLPFNIRLPTDLPVIHVSSLGESPTDHDIWFFAKENDLVILTKDADFSYMIATATPPPRVVHLRIGNMRLNLLKTHLSQWWPRIEARLMVAKLINVYSDRIEVISETHD